MSEIVALIVALFTALSSVDAPVVLTYPEGSQDALVGTWLYANPGGDDVAGSFVISKEDGVLYYTQNENNEPSDKIPTMRIEVTNGLTFSTVSENGYVIHRVVFVDKLPGTQVWRAMILVDGVSPLYINLQKASDVERDLKLERG